MQVSSAKPGAENSFINAAVQPVNAATAAAGAFGAFVKMPDRDASPAKSSELSSLAGSSSSKAGHFLVQKLVPLRSQSTGSRSFSALYPLPTSRDSFRTTVRDRSEDDLSWVQSLCMSLNSVWGAEIFNDRDPNEVQSECLKGLLGDVQWFCSFEAK